MFGRTDLLVALSLAMLLDATATGHPAHAATIEIGSDEACRVHAMNPDGSMGALLGPAQCYEHPYPIGFPGDVCPIWIPGFTPTTPSDNVGAYFSQTVFIPGAPVAGTLSVAVDDLVEVRVNGVYVGTRGSVTNIFDAIAAQSTVGTFDIAPMLVGGNNVVQFRTQNGPSTFSGYPCTSCDFGRNPCGLIFHVTVTYDRATPTLPTSWGSLKVRHR
jgi:hypothetical protein